MKKDFRVITEKSINESSLLYKQNWKGFLLGLLDVGCVHLHPYPSVEIIEGIIELKEEDVSFEQSKNFLDKSKVVVKKSKKGSYYERDILNKVEIQDVCNKALEELISMGLVVSGEWIKAPYIQNFKYSYAIKSYHLTERGVDVALKLQEHNDNDRRHKITSSFSNRAFYISIFALMAAVFSGYQSFKRLDLYEKQIEKMNLNQAAIVKEVKPREY